LGAEETTKFSIVNKIFFTLITFFSILLIHFWNSVTEAYEKKEFTWILKIIKVLYLISIVFFVMGLIISFYQKQIISFWLGENILELESLTFYLFSIYVFLHCINAIFQNLQNARNYWSYFTEFSGKYNK
jgi:O-antigen/teichoic acid export membrane protein